MGSQVLGSGEPWSSRFMGPIQLLVLILGLGVTIVGIVLQLQSEKAVLEAQVLSSSELTISPKEAGLKGRFTYMGNDVLHLYKTTIKFVNAGNRTIIGVGSKKTILGEAIGFSFPEPCEMLRIEQTAADLPLTITRHNSNCFDLSFGQWKSGETAIAHFYLSAKVTLGEAVLPETGGRDIIDGDVRVSDLRSTREGRPSSYADLLPHSLAIIARWVGGLITFILALSLLVGSMQTLIDTVRWNRWRGENHDLIEQHIKELQDLSNHDKQRLLVHPHRLPDVLWAGFERARPKTGNVVFDNLVLATALSLLLIILGLGALSVTAGLIPLG